MTPIINRKRNINFLNDVSSVFLNEFEPTHVKISMNGSSAIIIINKRISKLVIYKMEIAEMPSFIKDVVFNVARVLLAVSPNANM